jgi:hypothetical protein
VSARRRLGQVRPAPAGRRYRELVMIRRSIERSCFFDRFRH